MGKPFNTRGLHWRGRFNAFGPHPIPRWGWHKRKFGPSLHPGRLPRRPPPPAACPPPPTLRDRELWFLLSPFSPAPTCFFSIFAKLVLAVPMLFHLSAAFLAVALVHAALWPAVRAVHALPRLFGDPLCSPDNPWRDLCPTIFHKLATLTWTTSFHYVLPPTAASGSRAARARSANGPSGGCLSSVATGGNPSSPPGAIGRHGSEPSPPTMTLGRVSEVVPGASPGDSRSVVAASRGPRVSPAKLHRSGRSVQQCTDGVTGGSSGPGGAGEPIGGAQAAFVPPSWLDHQF